MKIELLDYTGAGSPDPARHAANLLVFTKATRLQMSGDLMEEIANRDWHEILDELRYMANTIPSSWEFVDYTFLITGVTRAFTHQFVRNRTGSYAQQTMRVLNIDGWTYGTGPSLFGEAKEIYDATMGAVAGAYSDMIARGAAIEDARGILPTNIHTNIVAKFNLRSLCDMFRKRASQRVQGEYRDVVDCMKNGVIAVHPWAKLFIERDLDKATAELEALCNNRLIDPDAKVKAQKLIDQIRGMA